MGNIKLFESKKIRSQWDADTEKSFFSIVDVIEVLTDSPRPRKYWNALKTKLKTEGSKESVPKVNSKINAGKADLPSYANASVGKSVFPAIFSF